MGIYGKKPFVFAQLYHDNSYSLFMQVQTMGGVIFCWKGAKTIFQNFKIFCQNTTKSNFQSADFDTGREFCPEIDSVCAINTKNGQGYFL